MRPDKNEIMQNATKVAKRIAITIVWCIPFMVVFAYLTRNVIKTNILQILCFVAIMAAAVTVEEIIARKKEKVQKEEIENKDVFR